MMNRDNARPIVLAICESASIDVSHSKYYLSSRLRSLWPTHTATATVMVGATDGARLRRPENGHHSERSPYSLPFPPPALYAAAPASSSTTMDKGILVPSTSAHGVSMLDDRPPHVWRHPRHTWIGTLRPWRTKDSGIQCHWIIVDLLAS